MSPRVAVVAACPCGVTLTPWRTAPDGRRCRLCAVYGRHATGEPAAPRREVTVKPARPAGPCSTETREAVLAALVSERRWLSVATVAELANVSETTARRALGELLARVTVEHAEDARGIAGALVERDGPRWRATHLAHERARCGLNRAGEAEVTGERVVVSASEREATLAIAELEAEVARLRAALAGEDEDADATFDVAGVMG